MLLVGLTGGIATGKTTVSTQLREELGVPVVDADHIARAVVEPGRPAYRDIVRTFGDQVLVDAAAHDDGEHVANSGGDVSPVPAAIDRAKLGRLVFGDETRRRQLNAITHPRIRWAMAREVLEHWWRGYRCASDWATLIAGDDDLCTQSCDDIMTHTRHPVVVVDAPLLFESKLDKWMDVTVVVECPLDIQAARFATRNPELTQAERQQRLAAQMPLADKCALADVVIDNGRGVRELREKVVEMVAMLRERERQRRSVKRRWFGVAMTVLVLAVGIGVRFMTMSGG